MHRAVVEACQRLDEAAVAFRALGDQFGLALTLSTRGQLALLAGDDAAARRMHTEGLAAARTIDNDQLQAQILDMLGLGAAAAGDLAAARDHYAAVGGPAAPPDARQPADVSRMTEKGPRGLLPVAQTATITR